jgi:hypothetical protein
MFLSENELQQMSLEDLVRMNQAAYEKAKASMALADDYMRVFKERTQDLSQGEIAAIIERALYA